MPPKKDKKAADRLYGLSDAEVKACICVLRMKVIDDNVSITGEDFAKLTGHEKANTASKTWGNAKAKIIAATAGSVNNNNNNNNSNNKAPAGDAAVAAPQAASAKLIMRAHTSTKAKRGHGKKFIGAGAVVDNDEEEEEDSYDALNEPAPKRSKK